jgi:hypothetical protein
MSKDDDYQRHLTPAPVPLHKLATIGDVLDGVADHRSECEARRRKLVMWTGTIGVSIVGIMVTVGIFVAKYVIVGAITLELDRRFPFPHASLAAKAEPSMFLGSAHAAEAPAMPEAK